MKATTASAPQRTEPMNQFLRCVEKMRAAEKSGDNPAPYLAQARQWLAIVKLANPAEAETLERELAAPALPAPAQAIDQEAQRDRRLTFVRLAWLGVPFACLFMIVGGDILIQFVAGLCLVGLLAFIFVN